MESKEKIIEAFRRNGFRATPQRIAIAQIVLGSKDHPTAEQVYELVNRSNPSISLSTVYNTLHVMRDVNMLQELAFDNIHRYDPNTSMHINLVCEKCGEIVDIEDETIEKKVDRISKRRGFSITGHRFDIYGICRRCEIDNKG
jgi:Fur family transcriptional regulator, peroxide stress response regulator